MKKSDLVEHLYQFQKKFHGERMTPEFERKLMEEILDECLKMGMLPPPNSMTPIALDGEIGSTFEVEYNIPQDQNGQFPLWESED